MYIYTMMVNCPCKVALVLDSCCPCIRVLVPYYCQMLGNQPIMQDYEPSSLEE